MIYIKNLLVIIFVFLSLNNISLAMPVALSTIIHIAYPKNVDDNSCKNSAFSSAISSLAVDNIPLQAIYSSIKKDPILNHSALLIELIQSGGTFSSIQIEANDATLDNIQQNLFKGNEIKLTEFEQCLKSDKNLQLVELVNFTPPLKNLMPDLDSKIEFIKKNDAGICVVITSKTLRELAKIYNPYLDVSTIEANIYFTANGYSSNNDKLLSKNVHIGFNKKGNIFDRISKPLIRIQVPGFLNYTIIERLQHGGLLQLTRSAECKGQKSDNPIWIENIEIS